MDGLMISVNTTIITIIISFFIAIVIKLMVVVLDLTSKPEPVATPEPETAAEMDDESEIAAVIAISKL
jgi:Na+-transporting methylmalonyl-CoA/oxaloacetate decarboxylase gamma subunit